MKNTAQIEKLKQHPVLKANLELLEDRLNDFISQFEISVPARSQKAKEEPRITFTVAYEPEGLHQLAAEVIKEKTTPGNYMETTAVGLPTEIRIKGPRAEECAELLTDAFRYSGIDYSSRIKRERDGAYSLGCRSHTDVFKEQMDALHDFCLANFKNRDLLAAMHDTERKLKALAKARPEADIETAIAKTYTRDATDRPILHIHYPTTDETLIAAARKLGHPVTVCKIRIQGNDVCLINGHFSDANKQEAKCKALLSEILASAQRAPSASRWQDNFAANPATGRVVAKGRG